MRPIAKRIYAKIREYRGDSLVSVLIAVSIAGILAMILGKMWDNNQRMLKKSQVDSELLEIRALFPARMPCAAATCKDQKIAIDTFRIGRWHFQALCVGNDVYVDTRKYMEDHEHPVLDPLKKIPMDWKHLFTAADGFYCTVVPVTTQPGQQPGGQSGEEFVQPSRQQSQPLRQPSAQPSRPAAQPQIPAPTDAQMKANMELLLKDMCPEGQSAQIDSQFNVTCK